MKYLVKQTKYYFDGHGEGMVGEGSENKFISDNPVYGFVDNDYEGYYYDLEDVDPESGDIKGEIKENCMADEDNLHEQDGYNCTAYTYEVKKISDEEAERINKILEEYNKI
jgi:hypothetical protein